MKKRLLPGVLLLLTLVLTACSASGASVLPGDANPGGMDAVDLTRLSDTMAFSEVFAIAQTPENYLGRRIVIQGKYANYFNEATNAYYHNVMLSDATACCAQGLEFIWNGEHAAPADYPPVNSEIRLDGIYSSYVENGRTYYALFVDDIEINSGEVHKGFAGYFND